MFYILCTSHSTPRNIYSTPLSVLEWYDFALFGFFSDIIAQVFFPPSDAADDDAIDYGAEIDTSNLINSFAVYGGAFLMRPVGGLTIGYVGDRYGRKQAVSWLAVLLCSS
jgi:MHS family proline/betaine transporter-like MFS transporter